MAITSNTKGCETAQMSRLLFNIVWFAANFFIPILQSHFATIIRNEDGSINLLLLCKDTWFWVSISVWIIGNVLIVRSEKKALEAELDETWLKEKRKLIKNVSRKIQKNDYNGADETIRLMDKLQNIINGGEH